MPKVSRIGRFRASAKLHVASTASASTSATLSSASLLNARLTVPSSKSTHGGYCPEDRNTNNGGDDGQSPRSSSREATAQALSRGKRKRQAKRDQYFKRGEMVMRTLRLRRADAQRGKMDGLDALRDALPPVPPSADTAVGVERERTGGEGRGRASDLPSSNSNVAKKDLMAREVSHMGLVLEHPSFKSDPFSAMREHLRNTLASQAKAQEVADEKRRAEDEERREESRKRKKEKKKELVGDRSNKSRKKSRGRARRGK